MSGAAAGPTLGERPHVTCLVTSSLDGRLHLDRWTGSPDGDVETWSGEFERLHGAIAADGWIVGRKTMSEMTEGSPHPPSDRGAPPRPIHVAEGDGPFAIALDRQGGLHFASPDVGGDPLIVLLGRDVGDGHLAELIRDGISYVIAEDAEMTLAPLLAALRREFGVARLTLEGGGHANGAFLTGGLVDELHVVLAPTLDGSPGTAIVEAGEAGLKGKISLSLIGCDVLGGGAVHLRYSVSSG